jgi:hypothetical protein
MMPRMGMSTEYLLQLVRVAKPIDVRRLARWLGLSPRGQVETVRDRVIGWLAELAVAGDRTPAVTPGRSPRTRSRIG